MLKSNTEYKYMSSYFFHLTKIVNKLIQAYFICKEFHLTYICTYNKIAFSFGKQSFSPVTENFLSTTVNYFTCRSLALSSLTIKFVTNLCQFFICLTEAVTSQCDFFHQPVCACHHSPWLSTATMNVLNTVHCEICTKYWRANAIV